jgi:lipoyl(octanoyl) transferase
VATFPVQRPATPTALWHQPVVLIQSDAADADRNMALDEAMLATAAETQASLVRLYRWSTPAVSFGRNQRCAGIYDAERLASRQVPAVRRLTGGRALLHGRELTYAVAAPVRAGDTLRSGYDAINDLLLDALRTLGVPAERAQPTTRLSTPGLAPCFEQPAHGEIVVNARKLVGSAQHREAGAFLQHGSILLENDQGMLADLASVPLPAVPPPAVLREFVPAASETMVAAAIEDALRRRAGSGIDRADDTFLPAHHVEAALTRYRDARWTWRR